MVSVRHKDKTRKTIVLGRASSADWKTRCIKAINTIHIFIFDKLCTLPPFIEINSVSALAYPSTGPLKLFSDPALLENTMSLKKYWIFHSIYVPQDQQSILKQKVSHRYPLPVY